MFNPFKPEQAADEPKHEKETDENPTEAEAIRLIKMKCELATMFASSMYDSEEEFARLSSRYKRMRNECIALADQINDEFYRGFAVHQIINMCIVAKDLTVARALLVSVRDDFLREQIFDTAPVLRRRDADAEL